MCGSQFPELFTEYGWVERQEFKNKIKECPPPPKTYLGIIHLTTHKIGSRDDDHGTKTQSRSQLAV